MRQGTLEAGLDVCRQIRSSPSNDDRLATVGSRLLLRRLNLALTLAGFLLVSPPIEAQVESAQPSAPRTETTFRLGPPPSFRSGDVLRVDFRLRLHADARSFSPARLQGNDSVEFRRARVGVQGRVVEIVEYEVEAELRDEAEPWRDVFVNFRKSRAAEVQGGRFKLPFGREQLTGVTNLDFIERALMSSELAPARDVGLMIRGRVADGRLLYQTGVFRHDGDNARLGDNPGAGTSWSGRLVVTPWAGGSRMWRELQAGGAVTVGTVPEGLNGLSGRTLSGFTFFEPVYVNGRRLRAALEASWVPGPFSLRGEYIQAQDERKGQGLGEVDLPDVIGQGWYVSGTWAITGQRKAGGIEPRRWSPLRGAGAVEVTARIEALRFGSQGATDDPPFRNPRAANLLENRDRVVTLGVNWYLNRVSRILINFTRETIADPERSPALGETTYRGVAARLQFNL